MFSHRQHNLPCDALPSLQLDDSKSGCFIAFLTPEKLVKSKAAMNVIKRLYAGSRVARFVIDESHCVCSWGHDFRSDYKKLSLLKRTFPSVPILALTATAPPQVRDEVVKILGMKGAARYEAR